MSLRLLILSFILGSLFLPLWVIGFSFYDYFYKAKNHFYQPSKSLEEKIKKSLKAYQLPNSFIESWENVVVQGDMIFIAQDIPQREILSIQKNSIKKLKSIDTHEKKLAHRSEDLSFVKLILFPSKDIDRYGFTKNTKEAINDYESALYILIRRESFSRWLYSNDNNSPSVLLFEPYNYLYKPLKKDIIPLGFITMYEHKDRVRNILIIKKLDL